MVSIGFVIIKHEFLFVCLFNAGVDTRREGPLFGRDRAVIQVLWEDPSSYFVIVFEEMFYTLEISFFCFRQPKRFNAGLRATFSFR